IHREAPILRFFVERGSFADIMRYVCNVHADLAISVLEELDRDGVVEVFGVGRVYCKSGSKAEIAPFGAFLRRDRLVLIYSLGFKDDFGRKIVRDAPLEDYRAHLGFVLSALADDLKHSAD